jgi:hypothetical protein
MVYRGLGQSSSSTPEEIVSDLRLAWRKTYDIVRQAVGQGQAFYTPERLAALEGTLAAANAILEQASASGADFSKISPAAFADFRSSFEQVAAILPKVAVFDPAIGAGYREIRAREQQALAAGALDSPYVSPSAKRAIIAMAYAGTGTDPRYSTVRANYNADGTSKTAVETATEAQIAAARTSAFEAGAAGTGVFAQMQAASRETAMETSAPEPKKGGMMLAIAAAAAAFLAFR